MSGRDIQKGATNVSTVIRIVNSTSGLPETAVEHTTSGIDLWYRREGAVSTDITEAALAALTTAHTDGGIEHINDGYYRLDLPDAAVASAAGVDGVMVGGTVTGMVVIGTYHSLVDHDPVADVNVIASDTVVIDNLVSDVHSRLVVMETAIDSDQAQTEASIDSDQVEAATATSNIHSRLVVMETAMDSDQAQTEASIDSDQVQNDAFVSDIHSRLVVIETALDSDAVLDATATSNIHSRLVVMETAADSDQAQTEASIDSDQVEAATATSNIHSRLVVMETANDSDQVILSDAILVIDDFLDTEMAAQTSNLVIIASDTLAIEAATIILSSTADSGSTTTIVDATLTTADTDYYAGLQVKFTSGNIVGQVREITDFTPGTDTITFSPATTQAVTTQTYDIIPGVAVSGLTAGQASDLALTEVQNSNIHSRLVVMETAADSDAVLDATATSNIHSRLVIMETANDSDAVLDATATSNIHSRLVVMETAMDSDQAQTEASIDSDQVQNDNFVSDIHSRLVVIETALDSDAVLDATATSNIHSRLVVIEAAIDSDAVIAEQERSDIKSELVIISDAILVIDTAIDSDAVLDATATSNIHSRLVVMETMADSDATIAENTISDVESSLVVIKSDIAILTIGIIIGACGSTSLTTTTCSSGLTTYAADQLIGRIITFTSGNAEGESSDITDYAVTNGVITFTQLTTAPGNTDSFKIT